MISQDMELSAEDMIRKAIIQLQANQPFFAQILMYLEPREMPEHYPMQTMCVDLNENMYFAEEFTKSLTSEEVKFVICHEALHIAFMHIARIGSRNQELSNVAQDVIVNMLVKKARVGSQPEGTIQYDMSLDSCTLKFATGKSEQPDGKQTTGGHKQAEDAQNAIEYTVNQVSEKTWEEVYAELMKFIKENDMQMPQSRMGFDHHFEGGLPDDEDGDGKDSQNGGKGGRKKLSQKELDELGRKWQKRLADAATTAKKQGKLPNGMERYVDELLEAEVDWRTMLVKYLRPHVQPVDWTYQRPHKKSKLLGVYMPTMQREGVELEVVVDTSGSISKDELTAFMSEIAGMNRSMQHVTIGVTFWDAGEGNRYKLTNANEQDILDMKPAGGGGTNMEAAMDWLIENDHRAPVVVVLTDGYTRFTQGKYLEHDVIWVLTSTGCDEDRIPYGDVVKMERT